MKKRPERHNLLFALAGLMIAGSVIGYSVVLFRWLGTRAGETPFSPKARAAVPQDLAAARRLMREQFLDPTARLRLAESLYAHGRWVDFYYVMSDARRLFGERVFLETHARVVLKEDPAADDPELEKARATAESDVMAAIPLFARLANGDPASRAGRLSLEILGKLAARKDSDAQAETSRLAQQALQELLKARPKDAGIFSTMALASWNRGDDAAARALVAQTLRADPNNAGALMVDGVIARADGDPDRAVKEFSAAWERNPEDLRSADELARIYDRERGDREAALPYYIAVYRHDPGASVGEPVERIIAEILDARRKAQLERVSAESLPQYLASDDGSLRAEACVRAAATGDPRWVDALAELMDDDDEIVRHNADYALYQIAAKSPSAIRLHKDEWLQNPRLLVRSRALNLLADLYTQETFPAVILALKDPDPAARYLAKTLVFDRYYKDLAAAQKAGTDYLMTEKDPQVLALYEIRRKDR
jgi:hypothetical protein